MAADHAAQEIIYHQLGLMQMDRVINWFQAVMATVGILTFMYFTAVSYTIFLDVWKESKPNIKDFIDEHKKEGKQ